MKTLYVLGDSISIHYGVALEKLCAGVFAYSRKTGEEGFDDSDFPQGNNGGDSSMVRRFARWMSDNGRLSFDYVLLNCGLHDIKLSDRGHQVKLADYRKNLYEILDIFYTNGCKAIWVRTTPVFDEVHNKRPERTFSRYTEDVKAYNAVADEVMRRSCVPVIDLFGFTLPYLPEGYIDHVHFVEELREKQAAYIFGEIRKISAAGIPAASDYCFAN